MDRRQFLAGSTLATVAIAGCMSTHAQDNPSDEIHGTPDGEPDHTIAVSASGEVEAEPDRAHLTAGVEAEGDDPTAVEADLADEVDEIRNRLADEGIPDDNIESGRFSVRPERDSDRYSGSHTLQIELEDADRVGEIINAVLDAGGDTVGRVDFDLSDSKRSQLRDEAVDHALENADDEANHLAQNRGVSITGTTDLKTQNIDVDPIRAEVGQTPVEYEVAEDDDSAQQFTELESGLVTVTASVEVTYGITE